MNIRKQLRKTITITGAEGMTGTQTNDYKKVINENLIRITPTIIIML